MGGKTLALALVIAAIQPAFGHDALPTAAQPLGWSYPWQCCSGLDCKQVEASAISEPTASSHGYTIRQTGEFLEQGDKRLKDSPDGLWHWCSRQAGIDAGKTICLFVPTKGF